MRRYTTCKYSAIETNEGALRELQKRPAETLPGILHCWSLDTLRWRSRLSIRFCNKMLQKRFRESSTQEISEKASQKQTRWCQCLPRWRRHCAEWVTPMPAKPRQLLGYHIVVLKPLSWRAGEVFIDALCSFRCIFDLFVFAMDAAFGVRRSSAPKNFNCA